MWWRKPLLIFALISLLGIFLAFAVNDYIQILFLYIVVNSLLALGLNLVNGFTGQFSLGHAGFMAVGAYFAAYASLHWGFLQDGWKALEMILFSLGGGLVAAVFGFIVGQPSLRLKGDYLAIVTLGFGEIIRVILLNIQSLGGAIGISGIAPFPEIHFSTFTINRFLVSFFICMTWGLICFVTLWRLKYSLHGKAFLSIREDEIAAESVGVPTTKLKVRAFVISSFFAGVAGALFAHLTSIITPGSFSFADKSVSSIIMVVLGGMGSLTGSILAAIFVTVLPELLRDLQNLLGIDIRMILFSATLILVMIFRPQGLLGEREIPDFINHFWKKYVRRAS
ncbi:MAG: branched-chain amino acid ABC transporter permease [Bdellovibrionaceae bacterium]|nr:branched-chain amino acid ABC transporter permease [Pseudobdellovibrionaceae bacterium]